MNLHIIPRGVRDWGFDHLAVTVSPLGRTRCHSEVVHSCRSPGSIPLWYRARWSGGVAGFPASLTNGSGICVKTFDNTTSKTDGGHCALLVVVSHSQNELVFQVTVWQATSS
jgi:hypothetical protein